MAEARNRPPRILIATPITQGKLYAWPEYIDGLLSQKSELLWDLLLVDNTDIPESGYVRWLKDWIASNPFGVDAKGRPKHRIRLARFGEDVDGLTIWSPLYRVLYADRLIMDKFSRWTSYDHLLSLECDVIMPPHALQTLYESGLDWAAAWMLTRRMKDPFNGKDQTLYRFPLLWHGLTQEVWAQAKEWDDIVQTGYLEPPGTEPFACTVTHLGCTLIRGQVVRSVNFPMTNAGGDVAFSWACAQAGFQPYCVPQVDCEHLASHQRPEFKPWAKAPPGQTASSMSVMTPLGGK